VEEALDILAVNILAVKAELHIAVQVVMIQSIVVYLAEQVLDILAFVDAVPALK
jgi:hypothetical protein